MDRNRSYEDRKKSGLFRIFPPKTASFRFKTAKRAERPSASTAIHRQPIAGPGFFPIFATVSFHKRTTRKPNDMIRKILLSVALLSAGGALHAQPKVIAHRGYWTAPGSAQNSLASFAKADSIGVYGSEMDVWLTGDDKLVVNHDQVYKGTDIDMARARARDITRIVLPNGENLPTLDEYLETVAARPATRLVLETKTLVPYRREGHRGGKDRPRAGKTRPYGADGLHLLLAERLSGVPEAAARSQCLLPGRRSLARKPPPRGPDGSRLLGGRAAPAPRMDRAGPPGGTRSQCLDGEFGGRRCAISSRRAWTTSPPTIPNACKALLRE